MRIWRRFHSADLVANIIERDPQTFVVAIWQVATERGSHHARTFRRLESAKAAADNLIRRTFGHRCSFEDCGQWRMWTT
jgi:hypothetical protein